MRLFVVVLFGVTAGCSDGVGKPSRFFVPSSAAPATTTADAGGVGSAGEPGSGAGLAGSEAGADGAGPSEAEAGGGGPGARSDLPCEVEALGRIMAP